MRTVAWCLAIVLASCTRKEDSAAAPTASSIFISVSGDGHAPPSGYRGTWIDIAPGVGYLKTMVMGNGATTTDEAHINGHPFTVEGEYVVIGPQRYGPIPAGTHVEIKNEGVFASGKLLGPLPERVAVPAHGK